MATRKLLNQKNNSSTKRRSGRITFPKLKGKFRKKVVWVLVGIVGFLLLFSAGTVLWWSRDLPDPEKISSRQIVESTKIFDRTGTHLLYEIGEVRRTRINLDQTSEHVISATLAAEDDQFFEHHGLDFAGIIRGVIFKPLSGQRAQGGSTITQQLIKNSILTPERTVQRKVKEAVLALELEQRFSKNEILEMYLNEIPYGSQSYGIEAASQTFFKTSAANTTIAQAALLASLPKAPTYYSPYGSHFEDLKWRQNSIIDRMVKLDMISTEEGEAAKAEQLDFQPKIEKINAPHFVFYVKEQLDKEFGERVVEQGGLNVITTLDMRLQTIAEEVIAEQRENLTNRGASNAALVATDPKTGDILTMVGSVDYFDEDIDGNVNVAIRHRSPGSSIKPFVYAAAWQRGFTPETILIDTNTNFAQSGQDYSPKNYDLNENGPVSMRAALANSMNIPAVKALYLAGVNNATNLANTMGMTSLNDPDRYGLSLVLGGGEVRLLDEVGAYGVFANEGVKHAEKSILKVTRGPETLFDSEENPTTGEEIITAQLARTVNNVLSDNNARIPSFGSRSPLQLGSRPVAAKTGTTQDFRDGWTMGFTPSLAVGVWAGNNDNTPMKPGSAGVTTASPIWNAFMRKALEGTPIEQFVRPEPESDIPHSIMRGELPEVKGRWEKETNTLYDHNCPVALGEPTTFKEIHNILFYINRLNPKGPSPADAEADGQFDNWERAVQEWVQQKNESEPKQEEDQNTRYTTSLPIPECNATNKDDLPKVKITNPEGDIVRTSPTTVQVEVDSPGELEEVRFLFDGQEIARREPDEDLSANITFSPEFSGRKTLVVLAVTKDKLVGRTFRTFIVNPDGSPPQITLHTPQNNKTYSNKNFPLTAKVTATDESGIELVDILYTKEGESGTKRIGRTSTLSPVAANRYETIWSDSPGPGKYSVYAIAYDKTGNPTETNRHNITIE